LYNITFLHPSMITNRTNSYEVCGDTSTFGPTRGLRAATEAATFGVFSEYSAAEKHFAGNERCWPED